MKVHNHSYRKSTANICFIIQLIVLTLFIVTGIIAFRWLAKYHVIWGIERMKDVYFPLQMQQVFIYLVFIILLLSAVCFLALYVMNMTCKRDNNFIDRMMSGLTRFYFIPLLFGSALFIIGECIDKNLSNKNHYKAMWWCSLLFSLIALLLMVLIYFFSDRNYWSKNLFGLILKDFWGRFIVLTWYNFLYCIYVLKMYTYLADLTSGNSTNNIYDEQPSIRRLTSLENWNKGCNIIFSILFGIGNLFFAFFGNNASAACHSFLIYLGMVWYFFKVPKIMRLEKYGGGIIDIIFMILSLALSILLIIRKQPIENVEPDQYPVQQTSTQINNDQQVKNQNIFYNNK